MKKIPHIFFIVFLISQLQTASAQGPAITVTKFRDTAESSAWCQYDSTLVAYNLLRPNGYWAMYTAHVSPTNTLLNETCLNCLNSSLPGKNYAQPCFQPNGSKYILFMAEKAVHAGTSANSIPGIGFYNDLWVMKMDGSKAYRLTTTPSTGISAMIEPYFSPNGKEIMWASMTDSASGVLKQAAGYWVINIAPFIDDTVHGPYIDSTKIRTIEPGGTPAFNEPYGWSPDGSRIIFASCYNQFWFLDDQIYTMDTLGNNIEQMSSTAHSYPYCEHAFYSTDGKKIVWMTDLDDDNVHNAGGGGDDWFIMNSDTTDQVRLTYFNDSLSPYWTGTIHVNGHGSYSPDGTKFIGDVGGSEPVQTDPAKSIGANYIISGSYLASTQTVSQNYFQCNVYPNPARENINLIVGNNSDVINYSIFNVLGYQITAGEFKGKSTIIDVSLFSGGIYFLKVFDGNNIVDKKFMVER